MEQMMQVAFPSSSSNMSNAIASQKTFCLYICCLCLVSLEVILHGSSKHLSRFGWFHIALASQVSFINFFLFSYVINVTREIFCMIAAQGKLFGNAFFA
jgi:hypothetical protein